MRYRAFISYSHADADVARWLMRRLEGYRVPSRLIGSLGANGRIDARLGAFFRDREELASAGDLGVTIREALAESSSMILVCSTAAAGSRWVNAEVEAFRATRADASMFCFVVDGDPGSDDPGLTCFPPALSAAGKDGARIEPLAADARRGADGRERAFLKLVAGLLGVGFDELQQREAHRRQRRLLIVTAASVLGMSIAIGLAATAYLARNDAQRRQAQAEDILGFMLGDLRKKLTTVGRLDLMHAVDNKAAGYFATLDPRDMSDRALEEQARSLTGIGEVRLAEGDHDAAMTAFREAHARSTALRERAPDIGQRLFDLAQAEYWIGFVALQQGRHDDTQVWFRKYRDSAIRLAAMDRNNFDWQKEVAYGHHNLAVLDESRGRYAEAERAMRSKHELHRKWSEQRPQDLQLRFESADTASWLGSLSLHQGKLADAEGYLLEQVNELQRNIAGDTRNAKWKEYSVDALLLLADVQAQRGRLSEARASVQAASPVAAALLKQDSDNNKWRVSMGRCLWWQANLEAALEPMQSLSVAAAAASLLSEAHHAEPRNERILSWLTRARGLQSQLALANGDLGAARIHLSAALALIEPAWSAEHNELLRLWLARMRLQEGELAHRQGNDADARQTWTEARQLLLSDAQTPLAFGRLDPLVRALRLLGQSTEAAPYVQRLDAAGYVPLQPWPAVPVVVAR